MKNLLHSFFVTALLILQSSPSLAQDINSAVASPFEPIDPFSNIDVEKIIVPNLAFTSNEKATKEYHRNYYFHKQGVDFATALADLRECEYYSTYGEVWIRLPTFVPFGVSLRAEKKADKYQLQPSLMAQAFGGMVMGPLVRRMHNMGMRNCMGFREYNRYGLTKEISEEIDKGASVEQILIRAKIASGIQPVAEKINP